MTIASPELLARCLDDLREGRASLEDLVAANLDAGDDLRHLLETALAIPKPEPVSPSLAFRQRARAQLLAHVNKERRGWRGHVLGFLPMPPRRFGLVLPLFITLLFGLGGSAGAAYAAKNTLPGDLLYPIKTGLEIAQVAVTASESGKAEQHLMQAAERFEELEQAQKRGRSNAIDGLSKAYANAIAHAEDRLERAQAAGEQIDAVVTRMELDLAQQQAVLTIAQSEAPPHAQEGLARAAEAAAHGQARAMERRGPKPKDEPPSSDSSSGVTVETEPVTDATVTAGASDPSACTDGLIAVDALIAQVNELSTKGQSLLSKLSAARDALTRCQIQAAQGQLGAFLNQLNADRRGCDIARSDYENLFNLASQVMTGPAGARPQDVPAAVASDRCDSPASSSNRPDSAGPPPEAGPPADRGKP